MLSNSGAVIHRLLFNPTTFRGLRGSESQADCPWPHSVKEKNGDLNAGLSDFKGLVTGALILGKARDSN